MRGLGCATLVAGILLSTAATASDEIDAQVEENLGCAATILALGDGSALSQTTSAMFVGNAAARVALRRGRGEEPAEFVEFFTLIAHRRAARNRHQLTKGGSTLRYMFEGMQDVCVSQVLQPDQR